MAYKSLAYRLAGLESKMKRVLLPLVIIYRGSSGLSQEQQCRIDAAKAENRPVRLIKTCIVNE
ncbi:hypothetical protein ABXJ76_04220 [Methylobacter sp. G7]|uniref:hypothetical protein n=1 Tax=Methylobacter sp. G7 TaxID=3230117 RepID=UPI003D8020BA